ncbi:tetratricopeptide repeat protein 16-like isoform X1 [Alosa pseudoharengus]|uniref:tetratricopeptide repeat protein 16-like isoform X1 n=1 Tax=Alosa pseudoharengus TaxID=34774 RepID=UPI003F8BBAC8
MDNALQGSKSDFTKSDDGSTSLTTSDSQHQKTPEYVFPRIFGSSNIFRIIGTKPDRPDLRGDLIIKNKVKSLYDSGLEAMSKSLFETAVNCFNKAISLQPNQICLYVDMGEAYLQLCDFQSAIHTYRQAYYLDPEDKSIAHRLAFIYYLQGQCLYDNGMFVKALESFSKAAEMKPNFRSYQFRSLACLTALGRYSDSLKLVSKWLEVDEPTADLFVLKARLHQQLNQVSLCYHSLKSALQLNSTCPEARGLMQQLKESGQLVRQLAVNKAVEGDLQDALVRINNGIQYSPEEASYYLFRGTLQRRLKDFTAAIEDLVLAIELSESVRADALGERQEGSEELRDEAHAQLVLTYNDFAVHCFSRGFYQEAAMLLSRAIEDQREESGLFINRGDCFFKQGDLTFALADYQQAEELDPYNEAIWARLAVVHNTFGLQRQKDRKYQEAAKQFSFAVKYNPGVSQYYENRAKAHYKGQKLDLAKDDAVCTRILDPNNQQVEPLLLSLFPGCSLSNILSSEMAQALRSQLTDSINACKQAVTPVSRLTDALDQLKVLDETDNQSEETVNDSVNEDSSDA